MLPSFLGIGNDDHGNERQAVMVDKEYAQSYPVDPHMYMDIGTMWIT
jgi:hypothetical protein